MVSYGVIIPAAIALFLLIIPDIRQVYLVEGLLGFVSTHIVTIVLPIEYETRTKPTSW